MEKWFQINFFELELLLVLILVSFYFLLLKEDFFELDNFDLFYKDLLFPGERGVEQVLFFLALGLVICLYSTYR